MGSLRKLVESISGHERKEAAEIAQLTSKLAQYEKRHRSRQELMKRITSFLMEEEADEVPQQMKGASPPL